MSDIDYRGPAADRYEVTCDGCEAVVGYAPKKAQAIAAAQRHARENRGSRVTVRDTMRGWTVFTVRTLPEPASVGGAA